MTDVCAACHKALSNDSPRVTTYDADFKPVSTLCGPCDNDRRIAKYLDTGELSSSLLVDALLFKEHFPERLPSLCKEVVAYYQKHWRALRAIHADGDDVRAAVGAFRPVIDALRAYYKATSARGHSGAKDGLKALLWGSAGRVLLTLQDERSQGDPLSKFGGANITLIFAEGGEPPNASLQSLCATKGEALALLKAARDDFPLLKPDADVCVA